MLGFLFWTILITLFLIQLSSEAIGWGIVIAPLAAGVVIKTWELIY